VGSFVVGTGGGICAKGALLSVRALKKKKASRRVVCSDGKKIEGRAPTSRVAQRRRNGTAFDRRAECRLLVV